MKTEKNNENNKKILFVGKCSCGSYIHLKVAGYGNTSSSSLKIENVLLHYFCVHERTFWECFN